MGLLEKMMARLDAIEARLSITAEFATDATPETALAGETTGAVASNVVPLVHGEQLINDKGIPWHNEHHASTKSQNNDGSWKRKKGGDKAAADAYEAQFTATPSLPVTPAAPASPATPSLPATPALPAAPATPASPGLPVTPAAPAMTDRQEAVKYIHIIQKTYGVSYDVIIATLVAQYGVDMFDNVPEQHCGDVKVNAKAWVDYLNLIQDEIDTLDEINEATNKAHDLMANVGVVMTNAGGAPVLGGIAKGKLSQVYDAVKDYAAQWSTWFAALQASQPK